MAFQCPSCGEDNRDDALMCTLCQVVFRKVPPKAQQSGLPGNNDFSAIAAKLAEREQDPFFGGFGFLPDYSAASLFVLDGFIDALWGTAGEAPQSENWQAPQSKQTVIVQFGAYVGESFRRMWKGRWRDDPRGSLSAAVVMPDGTEVMAMSKLYRRLKNGSVDAVFPLYLALREKLGSPLAELESYSSHARHLRTASHTVEAKALIPLLGRMAAGDLTASRLIAVNSAQSAAQDKPDVGAAHATLKRSPLFDALPLDESLASIIAIDAILDAQGGRDSAALAPLIEPLALYVGSVAVNHLQGTWLHHPQAGWGVILPSGHGFSGASFVRLRAEHGPAQGLWLQLEVARALNKIRANGGNVSAGAVSLTAADFLPFDEATWGAIAEYGRELLQGARKDLASIVFAKLVASGIPTVVAKGHALLASVAMAEGRHSDALAQLDLALQLSPNNLAWLQDKGSALIALSRLDDARSIFEHIVAMDAERSAPWLGLATIHDRTERHDAVLFATDKVLALRGFGLAKALYLRARALRSLGRSEEAIAAFQRAIDCGIETQGQVWLERAKLERSIGLHLNTMRSLSQIKGANTDADVLRAQLEADPNYLLALADMHAQEGQAVQAIAAYRRVLQVDPSHIEARRQLGVCLAQTGNNEEALSELTMLSKQRPNNLDVQDNLATLLVRMGRLQEALTIFDSILSQTPSASTFKRRGFCLASLGREQDALADYDRATKQDPAYVDGWVFRAQMEEKLGHVQIAKNSWRAALAIRNWSHLAQNARQIAHKKLWQLENPEKTLQPDAAEPLRARALILGSHNQHSEALVLLQNVLTLNPLDAESWHNKAVSLMALGRKDEALIALARADELDFLPSRAALAKLEGRG